jgi:CheY-like chemotaxis protein
MKQTEHYQKLRRYIHEKQQQIQRKFEEFRTQYEHSGKTSALLAQTECQGAVSAYQDILRKYSLHVVSDENGPVLPLTSAPSVPQTAGMLRTLQEYCQQKGQEAQQRLSLCEKRYKTSGDNKYIFRQRESNGEVRAYQNVEHYIEALKTEIPSETSEEPQRADEEDVVQEKTVSQRFHILVMDTSILIRRSIEMILQSEGFTVTTTSDGIIGFDIARKVSPDLILMDSGIARRSEEQLLFLLRRNKGVRKIPVVLLEGTGRALDERVRRQLGIAASIQKPFQLEELLETIQATLEQ